MNEKNEESKEIIKKLDTMKDTGLVTDYTINDEFVNLKVNYLEYLLFVLSSDVLVVKRTILEETGFFKLETMKSKVFLLMIIISPDFDFNSFETQEIRLNIPKFQEQFESLSCCNIDKPDEFGSYYLFHWIVNDLLKDIFTENIDIIIQHKLVFSVVDADNPQFMDFYYGYQSVSTKKGSITIDEIAYYSQLNKNEIMEYMWRLAQIGVLRIDCGL